MSNYHTNTVPVSYPYSLNAREAEALTVVLHMQLSGGRGRMG